MHLSCICRVLSIDNCRPMSDNVGRMSGLCRGMLSGCRDGAQQRTTHWFEGGAVDVPLTHRMRAGRGLSPCPIFEFVSGWVCRGELRGSSSPLLAQLGDQVQEGQTATVKGRGPGKAAHSPRAVNFHRRRLAPGRRVRRSPGRRQHSAFSWQRSVLKRVEIKKRDLHCHK